MNESFALPLIRLVAFGIAVGVGCIWGMAVPARAAPFSWPTVNVYDEAVSQPNFVDTEAVGIEALGTISVEEFQASITAAYPLDSGGVFQCESLGGSYIHARCGTNRNRILQIGAGPRTSFAITAGGISSNAAYVSPPELTFLFTNLFGGYAHEGVVQFGVTILSGRGSNGNVWGTAFFSGGGSATAWRRIDERLGLGDTFFGFAAPAGKSIVSVTITNQAGLTMPFDDVGFVVAITNRQPPLIERIGIFSNAGQRRARIRMTGTVNSFYRLEYSDTLPQSSWTPLFTLRLPGSPYGFEDPLPVTNRVSRFYRAVLLH